MDILDCLDDQRSVFFTGKVNILDKENKQLRGCLLLIEGELIHASMDGIGSIDGFIDLYIKEIEGTLFQYVVEPEIISLKERSIFLEYPSIKELLILKLKEHIEIKKLRPPANFYIYPRSNFVLKGDDINLKELEVFSILSENNRTQDIYKNTGLLELDVTKSLMSLRKKNALKIIKKG